MVHVHAPGSLHLNRKEVKALEDMKGLKLRAPTRMTNAALEALGAYRTECHDLWNVQRCPIAGEGTRGGNEALVTRLMQEGPPVQVNVALERDRFPTRSGAAEIEGCNIHLCRAERRA